MGNHDNVTYQWQQDIQSINHKLSEIISLLKASKQLNTTKEEGKRVFYYFDTEDGKVKESATPISATIKMQSSQPQNSKERIDDAERYISDSIKYMNDNYKWYGSLADHILPRQTIKEGLNRMYDKGVDDCIETLSKLFFIKIMNEGDDLKISSPPSFATVISELNKLKSNEENK